MKKYLMTGIAALALCFGFTSCSHDIEPMSDDEIAAVETQKIINDYTTAFQKVFGQPAPNHTWGFGDSYSARTRAADENHNQWYNTTEAGVPEKYTKLEEDPVVTEEERMGVFRYMNKVDNRVKTDNIIWKDYFVSQVWDGGTNYIINNKVYGLPTQNTDDPRQYTNNLGDADNKISNNGVNLPNGAEYTPLSISYADQNGATTKVAGGDKMDELRVDETGNGTFIHINNFNGANNVDPWYAGKTWMTKDKDGNPSGTYDFAYNQTESSYISHKYLIIPGTEIFANDPAMLAKYGQYYYVCFDFENGYTDEEKAKEDTYIYYVAIDNNGAEQSQQKVTFYNKYYTNSNLPTDAEILAQVGNSSYKEIKAGSVSVAGYKNGDKHFPGDNVYTDWIVRISPAKYKNTTSADLRVLAEDLSAGEDASDFDFNDVVFDVYFSPNVGEAYVMVLAAGGTLPLTVHGTEVHGLFNQPINMMINTHAEDRGLSGISGLAAQRIDLTGIIVNSKSDANQKIKIYVTKNVNGVPTQIELVNSNAAACKIGVDPELYPTWANERQNVNEAIHGFNEWVTQGGQLEPTNP